VFLVASGKDTCLSPSKTSSHGASTSFGRANGHGNFGRLDLRREKPFPSDDSPRLVYETARAAPLLHAAHRRGIREEREGTHAPTAARAILKERVMPGAIAELVFFL